MIYPNAPIREAVFDIKVDKLNIKNVDELLKFKNFITKEYPTEKKRHNITGTFQFSPDKPVESRTHSDITGYVYISEDKTRQIQIRIDGFTLNILRPYEKWETHFGLFLSKWSSYNELFQPNKILRIAARFINRIEIPLPFNDFHDYILNMPPIPTCLPQTFSSFFMQTIVPYKDDIRFAIITETIEPNVNSILPFILDIDIFQENKIENSIENLILNFNEIRKIKNDIFECCITDKTRSLFK